jgi:hypothetical protein
MNCGNYCVCVWILRCANRRESEKSMKMSEKTSLEPNDLPKIKKGKTTKVCSLCLAKQSL